MQQAPAKGDLQELVQLISQRVGRCLEREGLLERVAKANVATQRRPTSRGT